MNDVEILSASLQSIGQVYLQRERQASHPDGWVYEVRIDGDLLMSNVNPLSERELATRAIRAHGGVGPLRILVGGLGLGYTAQAALEAPQGSLVQVVDRLDFVMGWMKDGLLPLSEQLNGDERVAMVLGDVYADLLSPATQTWDLILIDVDHSPDWPLDPASLPFYTVDGQRAVRAHLAPGGVLAVWSAHDNDTFDGVLARAYSESWRETIEWMVQHEGEADERLQNTLFFGRKTP